MILPIKQINFIDPPFGDFTLSRELLWSAPRDFFMRSQLGRLVRQYLPAVARDLVCATSRVSANHHFFDGSILALRLETVATLGALRELLRLLSLVGHAGCIYFLSKRWLGDEARSESRNSNGLSIVPQSSMETSPDTRRQRIGSRAAYLKLMTRPAVLKKKAVGRSLSCPSKRAPVGTTRTATTKISKIAFLWQQLRSNRRVAWLESKCSYTSALRRSHVGPISKTERIHRHP